MTPISPWRNYILPIWNGTIARVRFRLGEQQIAVGAFYYDGNWYVIRDAPLSYLQAQCVSSKKVVSRTMERYIHECRFEVVDDEQQWQRLTILA